MAMNDIFGDHDLGEDVGLEEEDKKHARNDRDDWFRGDKNFTYRVALVYFHPIMATTVRRAMKALREAGKDPLTQEQQQEIAKKALAKRAEELGKAVDQLADHEVLDISHAQFRKLKAYYKGEGFGYIISRLGKDGPEADKVWRSLGDERSYFCTVLLIYPTNKDGDIIRDQLGTGWIVKPWRASQKSYDRLLQVAGGLRANELSIAAQDLTMKCVNEGYQNFDIDGAGKALWVKNDKFRAMVLQKALAFYKDLNPFNVLSTADLRVKLGMDGPAGEDVSDEDFDGILDNV
jgi:hypothetical protein